jgi:protease I
MANTLQDKNIAILAADGVERIELEQPRDAVQQEGAHTVLLSVKSGDIQAMDHDIEAAGAFGVDRTVSEASVDDYDALLLPGGTVNPDKLRIDSAAVAFVRDFVNSGKPVGVICHGPWTLINAGVARGRTLTSWPSVRTDLHNSGANVVDEEVVIDGNLTSSRRPDDLPAFCEAIINEFAKTPARAR